MKKNGLFIVVYIVLIVVLGLPSDIKDSKADIIDVYGTGAGNFLPKENCSLIMTNASVFLMLMLRSILVESISILQEIIQSLILVNP